MLSGLRCERTTEEILCFGVEQSSGGGLWRLPTPEGSLSFQFIMARTAETRMWAKYVTMAAHPKIYTQLQDNLS